MFTLKLTVIPTQAFSYHNKSTHDSPNRFTRTNLKAKPMSDRLLLLRTTTLTYTQIHKTGLTFKCAVKQVVRFPITLLGICIAIQVK